MNSSELLGVRTYVDKYIDKSFHQIINKVIDEMAKEYSIQTIEAHIAVLKNMFVGHTYDDFDWDFYVKCSQLKKDDAGKGLYPFNPITKFLITAIDMNCYNKEYKEEIKKIRDDLQKAINSPIKEVYNKFKPNLKPWNIIRYNAPDKRALNKDRFLFAPGLSKEICQLIDDYYNVYDEVYNPRIKEDYDTNYFMEFFDSLEGKFVVEKIEDLNEKVFEQQFFYFYKKGWSVKKRLGFILKFHIYVQYIMGNELAKQNYPIFDIDTLKYNIIMSKLIDGYKVINFNIYDKPEFHSKVLLKENNMDLSTTKPKDALVLIDLSEIKSEYLQRLVFDFLLTDVSCGFFEKRAMFYSLRDFIHSIEKNNKELITKENFELTIKDITIYKQEKQNEDCTSANVSKKFASIRKFLKYLEDNKIYVVDNLFYKLLTCKEANDTHSYKESFTKEEMDSIVEAMKEEIKKQTQMQRADLYQLYLYAFSIYSISDIRISSLFALTTDCVKETLNNKGVKEYKIVVQSKTSGTEPEEYNITKYVKSIVDEVISYTEKFREKCPDNLKDILFICQNQYRGGIAQLKTPSFNEYFIKILENYNIRRLRLAAVRNYYMQNVSNYVFSNGYDKSLIEKLTNHSLQVHLNHYDDINIMDFCQNFYNVEIGNVYLKGEVKEENEFSKQQTVVNGCGHCSLKKCALIGKLDCFMCEHFVTTLDCIPYYKNEIARIDDMIKNQKIKHEQEFLISKKKLLVAYLEKLMELEATKNEENK